MTGIRSHVGTHTPLRSAVHPDDRASRNAAFKLSTARKDTRPSPFYQRNGKAVGYGGPWKETAVKADVPSDQYLMTGYDKKALMLSHSNAEKVTITVEVDPTGYGDWKRYQSFEVVPGMTTTHEFPDDFNAYWLRVVPSADTTGTAQLLYQ